MEKDNTLHLLIIDESSNDAEMITNILRNAGHAVRATRVEDDEDMQEALDAQNWDLIITADKLSYIDAHKAIELLRKTEKDIPLIVAANGSENLTAGAALQAGACDFFKKDAEPEHLQYIVRREIKALNDRRQLRRFNKAARESEVRCRNLLDSSRDAITYVHEGMHLYANPVYMELFGYDDPEDIDGMPIMDMVAPADHDVFKKFLRKFSNNPNEMKGDIEVKGMRTDGTEFNAVMEFTPASVDGETCTQIIIRSASDKDLEQQLNILSKQDLLTSLYNRNYFIEALEQGISKAATDSSRTAMFYIEIDDFEDIKGTLGLAASDLVISDVAKELKTHVEEPDIIARFGDYSFTILLKEASHETSQDYAQKLCKTIEDHISDVGGQTVTTTVSIGVCPVGENSSSAQDVLTRASSACNAASAEGGNRVHLFNLVEVEQADKERNAAWVETLRDALANDQFFLAYQPIVSLHGDTSENYEVLLRMQNASGEAVLPHEFIPAAEQTSLMPEIDRWVIKHALQRLAEEHARDKKTSFFIKLSGYSLNEPGLLPWLSEQIKENRVAGDCIVFELDESSAFMHLNEAKAFITGMKQLHCKVVLDHFGSSLNSIKNLKHLDVDFLKIDGDLISSLAGDSQHQETVKSIIQTAHSMGKLTIAEFVQDANCLALLWQYGVNYIQGYFLQEPGTELDYDFSGES
ncbi:EAL domain-containing protein [Sulfuriflexus sp.]|uniref:EAL domain-containing response regulator n=1 Tax=Sulfuriflexus sp. TaxID=2015443 RepID=UPI0028CCDB75|nr:EAL domain-containing protein [Sulfuriflexus sp.]MDT8403261.1 EAL domain-containing protein [Sulfuriflexus sp.]